MNLSTDIITKYCRPMTPGERMRAYLERREYAMAAGHGVTCELVREPTGVPVGKALTTTATVDNISRFLRRGGAK